MNRTACALVTGLLWGLLPAAITWRTAGYHCLYVLLVSSAVGLLIYRISRPFYRRSRVLLGLWSIVTLYLACWTTGLAMGVADLVSHYTPSMRPAQVVLGDALVVCFVITANPILWLLFPLCFATHLWFARREPARQTV